MKNNDAAVGEFIGKIAEAQDRLEKITEFVNNHFETSPDDINYGHVGSAGYVNERLKEIMQHLGLEPHDEN